MKVMSPSQRLTELRFFLQLCFASLEHDLEKAARLSKLSASTVRRLAAGKATLAVHFGTVQALGQASGLALDLTGAKATVNLLPFRRVS